MRRSMMFLGLERYDTVIVVHYFTWILSVSAVMG